MCTIGTERLIIRRFNEEDYQDLYEYLSDETVVKFESYETYTLEECKNEARYRAANENFWAVCLKETGKVIGNIYFEEEDYNTYEIGYIFNKQYQGKGYALESVKAMIEYGIKELRTRRVVAMCNLENTQGWKLLENIGMRREGHLIQNMWFKKDETGEPIWIDTYEYGILADEWKADQLK